MPVLMPAQHLGASRHCAGNGAPSRARDLGLPQACALVWSSGWKHLALTASACRRRSYPLGLAFKALSSLASCCLTSPSSLTQALWPRSFATFECQEGVTAEEVSLAM